MNIQVDFQICISAALIILLKIVLGTSSLLLQTQTILPFQIWQQHQSNLNALKDALKQCLCLMPHDETKVDHDVRTDEF